MTAAGLFPCLQEPATFPPPEPDYSSERYPILLL